MFPANETPDPLAARFRLPLAAAALFALVLVVATRAGAAQPPTESPERLRILLDPGHGGTNAGAPSVRPDVFEKHLTLAFTMELKARLEDKGYEVLLTRTRDTYLTLRQRGRMANELDVDVFLSLHANATESHSHSGYETFILTPDAVDIDSRALRRDSGRVRPGVDGETALLLDDIERSTSQLRAAALAESVQAGMRKLRGKAGDRGVRQASMDALLGATMPAILVEIGFIDHPIEGEELMEARLREQIAEVVAEAVARHEKALVERR